ncbi:hypothetical protein RFI_31046 [Reticulomyxa filosa]|uniref:Uncharacterized protein n=1 Tax=Reticulomyxa filosa TaxID=46433 RepID=X6LYX4_RETFI|nr:hypothetical protein RFI_31046 [Reticulomyxa filosa]|eukprot:ETO06352.1 hypothetical protein RFI_31046 [Reticulomyxa filosa]
MKIPGKSTWVVLKVVFDGKHKKNMLMLSRSPSFHFTCSMHVPPCLAQHNTYPNDYPYVHHTNPFENNIADYSSHSNINANATALWVHPVVVLNASVDTLFIPLHFLIFFGSTSIHIHKTVIHYTFFFMYLLMHPSFFHLLETFIYPHIAKKNKKKKKKKKDKDFPLTEKRANESTIVESTHSLNEQLQSKRKRPLQLQSQSSSQPQPYPVFRKSDRIKNNPSNGFALRGDGNEREQAMKSLMYSNDIDFGC